MHISCPISFKSLVLPLMEPGELSRYYGNEREKRDKATLGSGSQPPSAVILLIEKLMINDIIY